MNRANSPESVNRTREKILLESARLFATGTYASVTMREIALASGIQPSSIYNYFTGKDKLLEAILEQFRASFRESLAQLDLLSRKEESLEGVLDKLFAHLSSQDVDIFMYYGLSILMVEQFRHPMARQLVFDLFHVESAARIRNMLDRLGQRELIPAQDTARVANFFVYFLMVGSVLRLHQFMNHDLPVDHTALFQSFQGLLARAVTQGV